MKKLICTILTLAIMLTTLIGCGDKAITDDTVTEIDPTLHSTIYEPMVPDFSFTHIYGDMSSQPTWLWVNCDISNAAIIAIDYDEETFAPSAGDVFYSFGEVMSGEGILIYMEMPECFPLYAFSYTAGGETYAYAMGYSGIDGSTTLTPLEKLK